MEDWELDFHWLKLQHYVKDSMALNSMPDMRAVLFMIGIQEVGDLRNEYTKEEKQDLMHVAVCTLLEEEGYFQFAGRDEDNWPHWESAKPFSMSGIDKQEKLLKTKIIAYFEGLEKLSEQNKSINNE